MKFDEQILFGAIKEKFKRCKTDILTMTLVIFSECFIIVSIGSRLYRYFCLGKHVLVVMTFRHWLRG